MCVCVPVCLLCLSSDADFAGLVSFGRPRQLATVYCPAWKVCWMRHAIHLIISHYATCGILCLHAVKGGPNTNMEVRFIEEIMPLLGFKTCEFRSDFPTNFFWRWSMERPDGAEDYKVDLFQWKTVHKMEVYWVARSLGAYPRYSAAPCLIRTCVISCPLFGADDEPVHDMLNEKILKGIDASEENAKNFFEAGTWTKTPQHPNYKPPPKPTEDEAVASDAEAAMAA